MGKREKRGIRFKMWSKGQREICQKSGVKGRGPVRRGVDKRRSEDSGEE